MNNTPPAERHPQLFARLMGTWEQGITCFMQHHAKLYLTSDAPFRAIMSICRTIDTANRPPGNRHKLWKHFFDCSVSDRMSTGTTTFVAHGLFLGQV